MQKKNQRIIQYSFEFKKRVFSRIRWWVCVAIIILLFFNIKTTTRTWNSQKHYGCHFHCLTHNFLTQEWNRFISTALPINYYYQNTYNFHVLERVRRLKILIGCHRHFNYLFIYPVFNSVSCPFTIPQIVYIECQHGWCWTQRKIRFMFVYHPF